METKDIPNRYPSPWVPTNNPVDLKILGKALEELGECVAALSRCLIQGIEAKSPDTGEINRDWLTKEVADVFASLDIVIERYDLDRDAILDRAQKKKAFHRRWHRQYPTDGSLK